MLPEMAYSVVVFCLALAGCSREQTDKQTHKHTHIHTHTHTHTQTDRQTDRPHAMRTERAGGCGGELDPPPAGPEQGAGVKPSVPEGGRQAWPPPRHAPPARLHRLPRHRHRRLQTLSLPLHLPRGSSHGGMELRSK